MDEVGGDAAIYIDPENPESAAAVLNEALVSVTGMRESSIANAARFRSGMIGSYLSLYEKVRCEKAAQRTSELNEADNAAVDLPHEWCAVNLLHIISSVNPAGGGPIEGVKQLGTLFVIRRASGLRSHLSTLRMRRIWTSARCRSMLSVQRRLGYAFSPRFIPWLRENRSRYDAVIVNGIWQFHSFATWRALRNSSTPYVLFTHGMLDPWFKKQYPLKHLKKWMYWPWAEYRVLRDAQAVLFTCEEERVLARQSFWLYRCNEVVVNFGTPEPTGEPATRSQ